MRRIHSSLVVVLIAGVIAGGCQSNSLPGIVAEHYVSAAPVETKAADAGVFVLWRWIPAAPAAGDDASPTAKPAGDRPVEIREVYADQGSPVGFRRSDGLLSAVAGPTTLPLEEAHYAWTAQTIVEQQQEAKNNTMNFWGAWWFWTSAPWSFLLGSRGPFPP
jgi:hypothetical protein